MISLASPIQIKSSKSGHLIPQIDQVSLHSEYDPIKEAKKLIDDLDKGTLRSPSFIVYGLGFAYHIVELVDRLIKLHGIKTNITVIEPNADLVAAYQQHCFPLSQVITIFCTPNVEELFRQDEFIQIIGEKPPILRHPQSYLLNKNFFDSIDSYHPAQDLKSTRTYLKDFTVRRELGNYSQQAELQQIYKGLNTHNRWVDHLIAAFGDVAYKREQGDLQ